MSLILHVNHTRGCEAVGQRNKGSAPATFPYRKGNGFTFFVLTYIGMSCDGNDDDLIFQVMRWEMSYKVL